MGHSSYNSICSCSNTYTVNALLAIIKGGEEMFWKTRQLRKRESIEEEQKAQRERRNANIALLRKYDGYEIGEPGQKLEIRIKGLTGYQNTEKLELCLKIDNRLIPIPPLSWRGINTLFNISDYYISDDDIQSRICDLYQMCKPRLMFKDLPDEYTKS